MLYMQTGQRKRVDNRRVIALGCYVEQLLLFQRPDETCQMRVSSDYSEDFALLCVRLKRRHCPMTFVHPPPHSFVCHSEEQRWNLWRIILEMMAIWNIGRSGVGDGSCRRLIPRTTQLVWLPSTRHQGLHLDWNPWEKAVLEDEQAVFHNFRRPLQLIHWQQGEVESFFNCKTTGLTCWCRGTWIMKLARSGATNLKAVRSHSVDAHVNIFGHFFSNMEFSRKQCISDKIIWWDWTLVMFIFKDSIVDPGMFNNCDNGFFCQRGAHTEHSCETPFKWYALNFNVIVCVNSTPLWPFNSFHQ